MTSDKKAPAKKAAKPAKAAATQANTVRAITRKIRISPMKMRPLMNSIVGKSATQAVDILTFVPNKSARVVLKTLKSAMANAQNNNKMEIAGLYVAEAHVDDAPAFKRFLPVARGSAHPIKKRSSHLRIVLSDVAPVVKQKKKKKRSDYPHAAKSTKVESAKMEAKE